ncbi:MAG: PAS domain S-box protein [Armatimonadetes bacterium]|nr:PAS domain S-box protein [Armatimonadota bacterium]
MKQADHHDDVRGALGAHDVHRLLAENEALRSAWRAERRRASGVAVAVSDGLAEVDSDGRVLLANDALAQLLGRDCLEAVPAPVFLRTCTESPMHFDQLLADARANGEARQACRLKRAEGLLLDVELSLVWLHDEDRCIVLVRDVSDQVAALSALAATRERFYKAFHLSPDSININRLSDGSYVDINEGFTQIMGYTRDDAIGRRSTPGDLGVWVNEEDRARMVAGLLERGEVVGLEAPFRRKDGSVTMGLMSARVIEIDGEACVLSITRDNSERYAARQAILAERERLRATLGSIGDGVVATDAECLVTLLNPVAQALTGWREIDAVGQPLAAVLGPWAALPADQPVTVANMLAATDGGERQVVREQEDGQAMVVAERAEPILVDGTVAGLVMALRDVTAERKLHDEMQRIAKLESLGVLAGGIAHDFNNLLTAIVGHAEMARAEYDSLAPIGASESVAAHLRDVEQAAMRARGLTQQLLTFAKGGAPVREAVALAPIVAEAVSFALSGSNCRCQTTLPEDLSLVLADPGQLEQVLHNLLLNAAQAMPDGGTIAVEAANVGARELVDLPLEPGDYVRLSVIDQGVGIRPEGLGRIFDPFFTTKPQGNGLGLASVHSIVRQHHGHVAVRSRLGDGARFDVWLPVASVPEASTPADESGARPAVPWRILVLDDEPAVARLLSRILLSGGHSVVTTSRGDEAIDVWLAAERGGSPFDLAILDLTVPGGKGGAEVVAELRRMGYGPRAVATSGYASAPVMARYSECGFAERLAKPYRRCDVESMLLRLQRADTGHS